MPVEFGGNLYLWGCHQLAGSFPRIDKDGEILPPLPPNTGAEEEGELVPTTVSKPESPPPFTGRSWGGGGGRMSERELFKPSELKCEEQLATLDGGSLRSSSLVLHPTLPLVVNASAREEVVVWDYTKRQRQNVFANGNPAGSRCTSSILLGEASRFLVIGSSEGGVRVWRNWDTVGEQQLVSAWQAVDHPADRGSPDPWAHALCLAWQPQLALLTAARGGSPWLRLWDIHRERCTQQARTRCSPRDAAHAMQPT